MVLEVGLCDVGRVSFLGAWVEVRGNASAAVCADGLVVFVHQTDVAQKLSYEVGAGATGLLCEV